MTQEEAILNFRGLVLNHPRMTDAIEALRARLKPGLPARTVILLGPTGVGKSTVLDVAEKAFAEENCQALRVDCPRPGPRGFEFGLTYWQMVGDMALGGLSVDHLCPEAEAERLRLGGIVRRSRSSVDEKRLGVLSLLRVLGPRVVILDEAQHIAHVTGPRAHANILDDIKDCVTRTGIAYVLAGTYELSPLIAPSDQLGRRSRVIHFPPYDARNKSDREAFEQVFAQLIMELPFPAPSRTWDALKGHMESVHEGCLGCVGVLKDWLIDALASALAQGADFIDWKRMQTEILNQAARVESSDKIREYRKTTESDRSDEIRKNLELPPASKRSRSASSGETHKQSSVSKRKRSRKPGQRSPKRDPVGLPSERTASS